MTGLSSEMAASLLGGAVPTGRDDSAVIFLLATERAT
jgi:hypothetical protein